MSFDFSALLLLLTVVSGVIWAVDAKFYAPGRNQKHRLEADSGAVDESNVMEPLLVEYARSFFPIFFIVLILRSFIIEPFRIPSESMMPTLLTGDFILVNKFDYGIRLPVLNRKIIDYKTPKRGDVIVFRYPEDPSIPYIKRVIGVPGDRIEYRDKTVYINGKPMKQEILGTYYTKATNWTSWHKENLGTIEHEILVNTHISSSFVAMDCKFYKVIYDGYKSTEFTVPDGNYFAMGDNRDNSKDSRCWGFVPEENLVGRAFFIWMHWRFDKIWNLPSWEVKFNRIGTIIR